MTSASDVRDWIEFVAAIAGVAGLLWAVFTYLCDIRAAQRREDPASICCDEEKMGVFMVSKPAWWKPWRPWARVEAPTLPTLTALLIAGDAGVWTSEMAEGLTTLNNGAAWRPLYESFFRNLTLCKDMKFPETVLQYFNRVNSWIRYLPKSVVRPTQAGVRRHVQRMELYKTGALSPAHLVNCIRPLDYVDGGKWRDPNRLQGDNCIWEMDMQPVWVYEGRPCIKVSKEELAALALSLGVVFNQNPDRTDVHGLGAFGISLDGKHGGSVFTLNMAKSGPARSRDPTMGSGYSTLFAKHMACGFLPFARKVGWISTIRVNSNILEALLKGDDIADPPARPKDSSSLIYLRQLPKEKPSDVFDSVHTRSHDSLRDFGRILSSSLRPLSDDDRWTWAGAVSGIAFGGLVPLTTRNVAEAVRFTAQGADEVGSRDEETYLPEQLERMINWVHSNAPSLHLFGREAIPARIDGAAGVDHISNLPAMFTVATVATIFSRYTVMLERLIALAARHDQRHDSVDGVFRRLHRRLRVTHDIAVLQRNPERRPQHWTEPKARHLGESCRDLTMEWKNTKRSITLDDCATVGRMIIVSWTYLVNLVSWEGEPLSETPYSTMSPPAVRLLEIERIDHDLAFG